MAPSSTAVSGCITSRAAGPCTAMSAYRELESMATASPAALAWSAIRRKSFATFDALTTSRKWSGASR